MVSSSRPSLRSAGTKPVNPPPSTRHATRVASHSSTCVNKADFGTQKYPSHLRHVQKPAIGAVAPPADVQPKSPVNDRRLLKRKFSASEDADSKIPNGLKAGSVTELPDRALPKIKSPGKSVTARLKRIASEDTRSLRSKAGGSRLKSDLATYFPNFDEIISGAPAEPGMQNAHLCDSLTVADYVKVNEPIRIVDEPIHDATTTTQKLPPKRQIKSNHTPFETIDLLSLTTLPPTPSHEDPLDDSVFLKAHRRAERREKQLRNIEKERAQHEKGQLEHLLECLLGPDWLRTMGITGITDGARKEYEPKRDHFIKEVRTLLNKFRVWREAEKRMMQGKTVLAEDDEAEEEQEVKEEDGESSACAGTSDHASTAAPLDSSDVDAWAARQLHQEARHHQRLHHQHHQHHRNNHRPPSSNKVKQQQPPPPPSPEQPFLSFFAKAHERDAALGRGAAKRHGARRAVLAFGRPLPDVDECEFELPAEYLTAQALMANARKRRRMNRGKEEGE
jgi:hypothetical protein